MRIVQRLWVRLSAGREDHARDAVLRVWMVFLKAFEFEIAIVR